MRRDRIVVLGAATILAAVGLSGCTHGESKVASSTPASAAPATPSVVASRPSAPLPPPEALVDVLSRLADPAVPGSDKVGLVEGATPASAATLDKFTNALRDGGYLPMTFVANDLAWSDKNPSNVTATVIVNTAQANNRMFTFPMEFAPFQGGWQLSRKTAEMLLAVNNSTPSPSPTG
ncbi:hypothetical protein A5791_02960 [Mycobacterium sp. 852002-51163_SCH5372311]|uniref:hypothetical protein n=1 Tax=Mycobacterium sp. 852002-51163_SCH5372311 TaxID=1834097 RepID=UPI0007FF74AA|nr:hypothetical protein [Mycobacterium sp. 852002-51163_SCH5372311]OBF83779.1 hypothetical protein A5791_02960 [Mycobacterium sp. 852002-51163_SCH5372311]